MTAAKRQQLVSGKHQEDDPSGEEAASSPHSSRADTRLTRTGRNDAAFPLQGTQPWFVARNNLGILLAKSTVQYLPVQVGSASWLQYSARRPDSPWLHGVYSRAPERRDSRLGS